MLLTNSTKKTWSRTKPSLNNQKVDVGVMEDDGSTRRRRKLENGEMKMFDGLEVLLSLMWGSPCFLCAVSSQLRCVRRALLDVPRLG